CGKVLYQQPHHDDSSQSVVPAYVSPIAALSEDHRQDLSAPQSPIGFRPDPNSQEFVPKVDKKLGTDLEAWLLGLSEHGVRRFGPGLDGPYRMQLLPIKPGDVRDTPLQQFFFCFSLPPPCSASGSRRVYARQLYDKLSAEAKEKYQQLIEGYVQRHWWHPIDPSSPLPSDLAPAEIFLLGGKPGDKRKPRL
ncbi:hypothetical protein FOZ62_018308, partial [Perkinsus olseni]